MASLAQWRGRERAERARKHYGPTRHRSAPFILDDLGPLMPQPPGRHAPLHRLRGMDRKTVRGLTRDAWRINLRDMQQRRAA